MMTLLKTCGIYLTLLAMAMTTVSCGKSEPSSFTMKTGEVKRVKGCHLNLDRMYVHPKAPAPWADFYFVCNVAESALDTKEWWGTQPQPLQFPMSEGDCVRLEKTFYCVEKLDTSDGTVTLKATYEQSHADGALLQRIQ